MSNFDFIINEVMEDVTACDFKDECQSNVLAFYNITTRDEGHNLKMIAWDQ